MSAIDGKNSTDTSPAAISAAPVAADSAAPVAADSASSAWPIATAATMNGK